MVINPQHIECEGKTVPLDDLLAEYNRLRESKIHKDDLESQAVRTI